MSALARYFHLKKMNVAGYDKTSTDLTVNLEGIGIAVHYEDSVEQIPSEYKNIDNTLVIITPAVPKNHTELQYFIKNDFKVFKRAQILGELFNQGTGLAIAGTHGKTTISTMVAWLLQESGLDNSAFLGGISKNFGSNLILGNGEHVVAEADEFDRSFLQLFPHIALISSTDADHLDIYGNKDSVIDSFNDFISQIDEDGTLVYKYGLDLKKKDSLKAYTYHLDSPKADFYANNIRLVNGKYYFDLHSPFDIIEGLSLQHPGLVNVENSVGALAVALLAGAQQMYLRDALSGFKGIKRRFDVQFNNGKQIYADDYAHHPEELRATIGSARKLYEGKKLTGVFQPHLFTRTRDFADEFAQSLSELDEVILLDIYPAREEPIAGVDSKMILDKISISDKQICSKENLLGMLKERYFEVLLTMGAGDIDKLVEPIKNMLEAADE